MNKREILNKIILAADIYNQKLKDYSFLYIYQSDFIEVLFPTDKFLHLTGVYTKRYANSFFKGLLGKESLVHTSEISFNARHPRDLSELKVNNLTNLYKLTNSNVLLFKGFQTDSYTFKIAISDLNISICLDEKRTKNGVIIPNQYIVRSFRVGDEFERAVNKFEVSHILSKNKSQRYYNTLLFGDKQTINNLPTNIKDMIKL